MTLRYAVANGNWSALATWDGGASLPGVGDDVYANNKSVTIDQDVTVLSVRTTASSPAVAGGGFTLNTGRVLNANIYPGSSHCVTISANSATCTTAGTIYGSTTTNGICGINITGTGVTLTHTGTCYSSAFVGASSGSAIYTNVANTTLNITGNQIGDRYAALHAGAGATGAVFSVTGDLQMLLTSSPIYMQAGTSLTVVGGATVAGAATLQPVNCAATNLSVSGGAYNGSILHTGTGTSVFAPTNPTTVAGAFTFSGSNVTLTANFKSAGYHGLTLNTAGATVTINGNLYGSTTLTTANMYGCYVSAANVNLTVNGNIFGGNGTGITTSPGLVMAAIGQTLTLNGNCTAYNSNGMWANSNAFTLNMTGNALSSTAASAVYAQGTTTGFINGGLNVGAVPGYYHAASFSSAGNMSFAGEHGIAPINLGGDGTFTVRPTNPTTCGPAYLTTGASLFDFVGNLTGGSTSNGLHMTGTGGRATVVGDVTGSALANTIHGIHMNANNQTLTVTGNVTGGDGVSFTSSYGIYQYVNSTSSGAVITINGNITAKRGSGLTIYSSSAVINITGDSCGSAYSHGIQFMAGVGATLNMTGSLNPGLLPGVYYALVAQVAAGNFTINAVSIGHAPIAYNGTGVCTVTQLGSTCGSGVSYGGSGSMTISGSINGNVAGAGVPLTHTGSGTLTFTGNLSAGANNTEMCGMSGTGVLNIIGNLTSYGQTTTVQNVGKLLHSGNGTTNITGNVTSNNNYQSNSYADAAVYNSSSAGTVNITGDVFAGVSTFGSLAAAVGATNASTGTLNVYGTAVGSPSTNGFGGAPGVVNMSTGACFVQVTKSNNYPNDSIGIAAFGTIQVSGAGAIVVDAMEDGSGGWPCASGRHYVRDAGSNFVKMRQSNNGTITVMGEVANDYPAQANVRLGVSYDFGAKTGTCVVPPAGSVALGVPVDATTGTAVLGGGGGSSITAAEVWTYAERTITDKSGFAPSAANNASAVRTELATELARVDQNVSAAKTLTSAYDAAKTASQFDPATDTVAHVTLVDTATTLTNSPDVPTPAEIAGQVRVELATELGRIDQDVSAAATLTGAYDAAKSAASSAELASAVGYILANLPAGITPADIWAHATRSLTQDVGLSPELTARLENCSTVQTTGDQLAALGV